MKKSEIAVFIGHRDCDNITADSLIPVIEEVIQKGVYVFCNGGMGNFDRASAMAVYTLKLKYPHIRNFIYIPYENFKIFNEKIFDEIIYPFPKGYINKYNYKAAIPLRNEFMVRQSGTAICYVEHTWGGAGKTYQLAQKEGLDIINLYHQE